MFIKINLSTFFLRGGEVIQVNIEIMHHIDLWDRQQLNLLDNTATKGVGVR